MANIMKLLKTLSAYVGKGDARISDIDLEATANTGSPIASDINLPSMQRL